MMRIKTAGTINRYPGPGIVKGNMATMENDGG